MRDPNEIQQELDAAQGDLEQHVRDLKKNVDAKLETPKKVIAGVKSTVSFGRKHYAMLGAIGGTVLLLLLVRRLAR